jgi:hypothetical protein
LTALVQVLMFRLRNPRFLLAFPTVFCMWLSQDKSLVMVSPKYLLASVVVNISSWSVYVASMIWRLFYLILITVHFDGLKFICQVFSHSSNAARSSCSIVASFGVLIGLNNKVSSAKRRVSKFLVQLGMSLI